MVVVLGVGLTLWVRGVWADTTPNNPKNPDDGPRCQLYQPPGEGKQVRCAIVLPYPMDQVLQVVTDYEHYDDFLPYLTDIQVTRQDKGCQMTGEAASTLHGSWHFQIEIHEESNAEHARVWWDQAGGEVLLNRGTWSLTPQGANQTLLVLALETEVHNCPTFFLRNVFLYRLPRVVRFVEKRLQQVGRAP
jgi:ribosome-associated toxin RatA of RatAB toxin-antitoxin module